MEAPKPTAVPDIKTLRDAIPAKCFERSMLRSLSYVARDLVAVSVLFYSAVQLMKLDLPLALAIPAWGLYSFVTGLFFTGLWILAHECGHDSFSADLTVNATVGWALHSMLMVPFFSWKFSHSRHHRYHNHMEKDTVFVPHRKPEAVRKSEPSIMEKIIDHTAADAPIFSILSLAVHQLFGWPMYILLNAGAGVNSLTRGNRKNTPKYKQSHLDPTCSVFTQSEMPFVALSNVGLLITLTALIRVSQSIGVANTCLMYGLPYLWMNHWIVAITYLHHTHEDAAHYEAEDWTFVKGALSTVDREFGFIGRHIFHGIIEYHVVHHMFPRIPFYHCEEATWAVAPMLGDKYIEQRTNFFIDLWEAFTQCKYVESDKKGSLMWAKS
ncbi:fatty acid desaturase, type 1 [Ophiobolus disseminans]|uniref:Fatty acid desaturase, type 1 n=1 Tax=Ophiobolus disseminans TaxID=1469910 RepID=A0A6A7AJ24_9PLEO|nr:fatty acid desaturase, type 1 [Ophiobolus disseminans]